ncbi:MAG: hypothetical protein ABI651_11290, partial [Verrucomicrobiota bacterium]
MPVSDHGSSPDAAGDGRWFARTHWSVVLVAGQNNSPEAAAALEKLCRAYWRPLYCYIRREGYDVEEAQDLTQVFNVLQDYQPRAPGGQSYGQMGDDLAMTEAAVKSAV